MVCLGPVRKWWPRVQAISAACDVWLLAWLLLCCIQKPKDNTLSAEQAILDKLILEEKAQANVPYSTRPIASLQLIYA